MGHSIGSPKCWRPKRFPSLREISFVFLCLLEMFKHLDILLGYPTEILWGLELGVSHGHHAHCWWLTKFWDQPFMCIPFPFPVQQICFSLQPLQPWDARRRKFLADVNAGTAWLGLGACVLPARLRGIGGYSEQRLCVPSTHKKTPEPFPPTPQI